MTPEYRHHAHSACAISVAEAAGVTVAQLTPRICPYVLNNFKIKGTRCVSVVTIYPPVGFGESDIYWHLNYYWSRSEVQKEHVTLNVSNLERSDSAETWQECSSGYSDQCLNGPLCPRNSPLTSGGHQNYHRDFTWTCPIELKLGRNVLQVVLTNV